MKPSTIDQIAIYCAFGGLIIAYITARALKIEDPTLYSWLQYLGSTLIGIQAALMKGNRADDSNRGPSTSLPLPPPQSAAQLK